MNRFLQLHLLTSYPPSNLNRDDLGRPKTAVMGGALRLRVSSQSLKRAWRTSDAFKQALDGHVGIRTKEMGVQIYQCLREQGVDHAQAMEWARTVAGKFGKVKEIKEKKKDKEKDKKEISDSERLKRELSTLETEQLVHFSPEEQAAIGQLTTAMAGRGSGPRDEELNLLRRRHSAADIALFGRMLAGSPSHNMEAAAQVAHAISVHKVQVEDDFFTAVDDLNDRQDDVGAGHMGETEFGAAVYYLYLCVDRRLLTENLGGDGELACRALGALLEAAATVPPTGKQNSFASRAFASYILAEKSAYQPRSLAVAFLKPVWADDVMDGAIQALERTCANIDRAYKLETMDRRRMNAYAGDGSLAALKDFVASE